MTQTDIDPDLIAATADAPPDTIAVDEDGAATLGEDDAAEGSYIPLAYWSEMRAWAIRHRESPAVQGCSMGHMVLKAMMMINSGLTP